jgi:glutaredoxin
VRTLFATLAAVVLALVGLHVFAARMPAPAAPGGASADSALGRVAAVARALPALVARGGAPDEPADAQAADTAAPVPGTRVYWQYVDASGRVTFVQRLEDVPAELRSSAGRIEVAAKPAGSQRAAPAGAPRQRAWAAAAADPEVVIYTAPWCGWCRKALAYLDEKGVPYENRDIESNPDNKAELLRRSGRTSIPFLVIGEETVRGFDEARIELLLARS